VGRGRHAIELHAGAGFFTLALARRFEEVEAIEVASSAVADLRANLLSAGLERVRVVEGDVEEVLKSRLGPRPELVLLDPPRAGLSPGALESLAELSAARIVYLSCDPATLARDSARLRERGYALESVQGFDLFPQTPHVEALAVLTRGDAPGG
jgi:23S rRNA (uracil1939-C5)-methyltransferase